MRHVIAADGSALGNPGPAGWCWYRDEGCWAAGGWQLATNNIGELTAVLELLRATRGSEDEFVFLCDSKYAIDSITKWMAGWKRKGWKKADGEPVKNLEIMKALDEELAGRRHLVSFEWVKGHAGHELNEAADELARAAASAYQRGVECEAGPGWTGDEAEAGAEAVGAEVGAKAAGVRASGAGAAGTAGAEVGSANTVQDAPSYLGGFEAEGLFTFAPQTDDNKNMTYDSNTLSAMSESRSSASPSNAPAGASAPFSPAPSAAPVGKPLAASPLVTNPSVGSQKAYKQGKYYVEELELSVPLYHADVIIAPDGQRVDPANTHWAPSWLTPADRETQITIFARVVRKLSKGDEAPTSEDIAREKCGEKEALVFFQGGPGCADPRVNDWSEGWYGKVLEHYTLVLLDQRGTGRSTPLDNQTLPLLGERAANYLRLTRADQIVGDAESLRRHLGFEKWTVMGQSYGGFIITAYLSRFPERITRAYVTGGLPGMCSVDDIYRLTYQRTAARNEELFARYPWLERKIREVCAHLLVTPEYFSTGERLSPTRLRSVGMNLGRTQGLETLLNLFESPFVQVGRVKRLTQDFLGAVEAEIGYAQRPLYAVFHEAIYAEALPGLGATRWAADRVRESVPGFSITADPLDTSRPYYLTGEHFGAWTVLSDESLRALAPLAEMLAGEGEWPVLYDLEVLGRNSVPVYAVVYRDDIFVPRELSLDLAERLSAKVWECKDLHHDGIRAGGNRVIDWLLKESLG